MLKFRPHFFRDMWSIAKGYWFSAEKVGARLLLTAIVSLNLGHVYLLVLLNQWNNRFYNSLQDKDKDAFFSALGEFSVLAAIFIIVAVYEIYLQQMLEIKWRRWLTASYLENWLHNRTYYLLQLLDNNADNPDQRISEDIRLFVSLCLRLSLGLLKAGVTLFSFVAILWTLSGSLEAPWLGEGVVIPGYMVWVALLYSIAGTYLTARIGRPLVDLNFNQQRYEADFRFSLIRLRENSEGIAFYGGEPKENRTFSERFQNVYGNFRELMKRQKKLTWFTSGYSQIAIIFPFLVAAPRFFSNQIQLGGLIQTASAFGRVQDALSYFVESYALLAEWQAVVNRLSGFTANMDNIRQIPARSAISISDGTASSLAVNSLSVSLPNGSPLLTDISFHLPPGDSLLISGPSGCGKSTLMRTLAGLWPFGEGRLTLPGKEKVLFLPQKSYLPLGTLRDVLLYPYGPAVSDETVRDVLRACRLEHLTEQLSKNANWSQMLSMGEQQRIAFARAILQSPDWLFLDEATSALDEPTEQVMYELLRQRLPSASVISVGHRDTLRQYHKTNFIIQTGGSWRLQPLHL